MQADDAANIKHVYSENYMHVVRKNGNVCTLFHSCVFVGDAASSSDNSTFI